VHCQSLLDTRIALSVSVRHSQGTVSLCQTFALHCQTLAIHCELLSDSQDTVSYCQTLNALSVSVRYSHCTVSHSHCTVSFCQTFALHCQTLARHCQTQSGPRNPSRLQACKKSRSTVSSSTELQACVGSALAV
jgi:hypothetical protein